MVCTILALGRSTDGQHCIAMEYVEGEPSCERSRTVTENAAFDDRMQAVAHDDNPIRSRAA
jgi:hypothetical protein